MKSELYKADNKLTQLSFDNNLKKKKTFLGFHNYYFGINFSETQIEMASHNKNREKLTILKYYEVESISFDIARCRSVGNTLTPRSGAPWALTLELEFKKKNGESFFFYQYDIQETLKKLSDLCKRNNVDLIDLHGILEVIDLESSKFEEYLRNNIDHPGINIPNINKY